MIRPLLLPRLAATRELLQEQCRNPSYPGSVRVGIWCFANYDDHGHAPADPGQLQRELKFSSSAVLSQAIARARAMGAIDPCSTAHCLVVPGHSVAPCEQHHREVAA